MKMISFGLNSKLINTNRNGRWLALVKCPINDCELRVFWTSNLMIVKLPVG